MAKQSAAWRKKRAEVLARADHACEECGATDKRLDIHHRYYESGKAKWDYPIDTLACLCPRCHGLADEQRRTLVRATGKLVSTDVDRACGYMDAVSTEYSADATIVLRTYEYAMGAADFFSVDPGELIRMADVSGAVKVSTVFAISRRRYMRDRTVNVTAQEGCA